MTSLKWYYFYYAHAYTAQWELRQCCIFVVYVQQNEFFSRHGQFGTFSWTYSPPIRQTCDICCYIKCFTCIIYLQHSFTLDGRGDIHLLYVTSNLDQIQTTSRHLIVLDQKKRELVQAELMIYPPNIQHITETKLTLLLHVRIIAYKVTINFKISNNSCIILLFNAPKAEFLKKIAQLLIWTYPFLLSKNYILSRN